MMKLEGDAAEHDVPANVRALEVVCGRRDPASRTLDHERQHVEGAEEDRVHAGAQPAVVLAEHADYPPEDHKVGGEEGRRADDGRRDLQLKSDLRQRLVVRVEPRAPPDDLEHAAEDGGVEKEPLLAH